MNCVSHYESPLGNITMVSDGEFLIALWIDGQNHAKNSLKGPLVERDLPVFEQTKKWLDIYFAGEEPKFLPPLKLSDSPFRRKVQEIMLGIPYGKTMTYGEIASIIAEEKGVERMSAQAIGGAVGHNTISIIVPCHRVIGSDGSLTGYSGGIDKKIKLLELERADMIIRGDTTMKNKITLEKISWDNYLKVLKLRVKKDQENFVATNKASLIHAFLALSSGTPVYSFAIKNGKTIVGFIQMMYSNDWTAEEREDWLSSDEYKTHEGQPYYYIWRYMIDKKYQGRGYGRESFKQALDFIKTFPAGKADYVILSYEPGNELGKRLYGSFGFEEVFTEYLHEGDEVTAMLKL